ncbi:MAG: prepilin-type N-terminal cleavage/methylation domain-containing protein [Deinococcota bacterium]
MNRRPSPGFTLIELLVAISVIAVLAAFMTPNLVLARKRANLSSSEVFARNVIGVIESKRDNSGSILALDKADCGDANQGFPFKPSAVNTCTVTALNGGADYKLTVTLNPGLTSYSSLEYDSTSSQLVFK